MRPLDLQQVTVYREPGRYAGWPANYGMWCWQDEILLVFTRGHYAPASGLHTRDRSRPFVTVQARSRDGGHSWDLAPFAGAIPGGRGLSADEHVDAALGLQPLLEAEPPAPCPGLDLGAPDAALLCARTGLGPGTRGFFYHSTDRGHHWTGPWALRPEPDPGLVGLAARTDVLLDGPRQATLLLTGRVDDRSEGGVFCARTTDGGARFEWRGWVVEPPTEGFAIMPASVRLPAGRLVTALRRRGGGEAGGDHWIDLHVSDDDGRSWSWLARPVASTGAGGNPPALTLLRDGRLHLAWGDRDRLCLCARLSADGGLTWEPEIVLRAGAGSPDLGYPRTVERPDGTLVTACYWNDHPEGERYIAAVLWRP